MRSALELNETECQVLIDCLNEKIYGAIDYMDAHEEDWNDTDEALLEYKLKLRCKIQGFRDLQETLDKGGLRDDGRQKCNMHRAGDGATNGKDVRGLGSPGIQRRL